MDGPSQGCLIGGVSVGRCSVSADFCKCQFFGRHRPLGISGNLVNLQLTLLRFLDGLG